MKNLFNILSLQVTVPPSVSSQSTDSEVVTPRRRSLEDENVEPSSSHSDIPNGDAVVSTEDVKPDPIRLSAQLPTTNDLVKRGLKRRIVSDDEEEDLEMKGPPDLTKSDQTKLVRREIPPVVTLDSSEESSSEDEKPIRYFVFIFLIISFHIYLYFCQSKNTNLCNQQDDC